MLSFSPRPRVLGLFILLLVGSVLVVERPARVAATPTAQVGAFSAEVIGQVTNPSPALSYQYGYLNHISGLDPAVIAASADLNERTALLTFYSDTQTQRVITNGPLRVIDRTGQFGIYLDGAPNGEFGRPATFQDGEQVVAAEQHHQVIVNTLTGAFTANFDFSIVWSKRFTLSGAGHQLGRTGEHFSMTVSGQLNQAPPPTAYIAGFMTGLQVQ